MATPSRRHPRASAARLRGLPAQDGRSSPPRHDGDDHPGHDVPGIRRRHGSRRNDPDRHVHLASRRSGSPRGAHRHDGLGIRRGSHHGGRRHDGLGIRRGSRRRRHDGLGIRRGSGRRRHAIRRNAPDLHDRHGIRTTGFHHEGHHRDGLGIRRGSRHHHRGNCRNGSRHEGHRHDGLGIRHGSGRRRHAIRRNGSDHPAHHEDGSLGHHDGVQPDGIVRGPRHRVGCLGSQPWFHPAAPSSKRRCPSSSVREERVSSRFHSRRATLSARLRVLPSSVQRPMTANFPAGAVSGSPLEPAPSGVVNQLYVDVKTPPGQTNQS